MKKSILDTVHETAKDLHKAEVMKDVTLREFDALIKRIWQKSHASQAGEKR